MYLPIFFKEIFKIAVLFCVISFTISIGYGQGCDPGASDAEPGNIIITEIFTRSNGNIPDYIEIYNRSLSSHCLLGWKISIYGTEYILDNADILDALNLSPFNYMIITGQDGYFSDEANIVYLANGDDRVNPNSNEYNADFASFVQNSPNNTIIENAVWAPFALSHSASEIELITDENTIVDRLEYNSTDYQIGGNYIGHSIELTNDIPQGLLSFELLSYSPENWAYSKHSRPFMFSSDELYSDDNLFMEFGSPGRRNYLNSVITVTNLQCGPDPAGSEFCHEPGAECVSQNDLYNSNEMCIGYYGAEEAGDYWEFFQNSSVGLCWYECAWSDTTDYINMNLETIPKYSIYHDRIPGGTKSLIFDADQSDSHLDDDIVSYKWFKNGNVFQNGDHIESQFAEGAHELVLLVKNEDDIWAVDTFNFVVDEPNKEPTPIISVDATEYVVAHNGDPSPASREITLSGVNSCDCNDYIRYDFLLNGNIINDADYDCSCEPTVENPIDWVEDLRNKCENQNQVVCEDDDHIDYCRWNIDGEDNFPETTGACEYSEIEYFFWTKDGEIEGETKEFVTNVPDIGEYVFSLILTDTYGESNSASTNIFVNKEENNPPIANIVGQTTIMDFTNSNGIPYDTGELDLQDFDESYDVMLNEGQNEADQIFSQWYTIEGSPINSNDSENDAHKTQLALGTYTFILEVLDSYNCYSKNNYGDYLNSFEVCDGLDFDGCKDYSSCRWFENECTPYCELYAQGFCDGAGIDEPTGNVVSNEEPCHVSGINVDECGIGGSCIYNENLQSADYDTLTVILSEENSPPIVDIGTNMFSYMEETLDSIVPSVYDIEFYLLGLGYCFHDYVDSELCDPEIPPLFDTREEKCCIQVEWEVVESHYGGEGEWDNCAEMDLTHPYCNELWLISPNERVLNFYPPENTDFYPDSVKLKLTATDPFYNAGISELFEEDEVIIIIENNNQPPVQIVDFLDDGYYIEEDKEDTFLEFDLSEHFFDPDGEVLRYNYFIPNNQLIDVSVIDVDENGYLVDSRLDLRNIQDKNGDVEVFIYALDSEYTIQTSFSVIIVPNNDIPNIYSENYELDECTENCSMDDNLISEYFVLDGDAGGCGEFNNSDDCEDGFLTFEITRHPIFGLVESLPDVTTEVAFNYYPYENFFGYDTLFYQITDIGTSAGIVDTLMSEVGHIVFKVLKSDNNAPIVQRTDFTIYEDFLIHFTVYEDSIIYSDSLDHVYIGLNILDQDNNCLLESNLSCNDSIYNFEKLKVVVQPSSTNYEYYEIIDSSTIMLTENYNDSLIVPVEVWDFEFENSVSLEYEIDISLIPVNDKPTSENMTLIFNEDEILEFELTGEDYEGDLLSYEIIKLPTKLDSISPDTLNSGNIKFEYGEIPILQFKPLNDFNGDDNLIYLIHDNGTTDGIPDSLTSDSIYVWFDILPINDFPRIDSIFFESDSLITSISEDTSDVKIYMIYTDIDSDEDLNKVPDEFILNWEFNIANDEEGLTFWFSDEEPIIADIYSNPFRKLGIFTIDSLLANWNGTDTSIIKITDNYGLVNNYNFALTVQAINDPPTISSIKIDTSAIDTLNNWEYDFGDNDEIIIAEDSKDIPLIIVYFDIDTDENLNVAPDTIAGFSWNMSSLNSKLNASYNTIYDEKLGKDIFEFKIDSIKSNWNGYDTLITIVTDTLGDSYYHTLGLQIYQVNDNPEPFNYFSLLNEYPLNNDSYNFYMDNNSWTYRLPYQSTPISNENSEDILVKWIRTSDIDLVDSLNNHQGRIKELFYRLELSGDKSGYTFVLKSRINDTLFNNINFCVDNLEVSSTECNDLGITDNTIGFAKIDLTQTFLAYKGAYYDSLNAIPDTVYKKLDLTNDKSYYCNDGSGYDYGKSDCNNMCPESCSNTDYHLNVVAYNASRIYNPDDSGGDEGYDFQYVDVPQYADVFSGDSSNFNIDLTLPDFQFNVIRNDVFWEYYDLYITNSEGILDSIEGVNYKPILIIDYSNGIIDTVDRTSSEHGPIHYTSKFIDEDSITFIYSARDSVENYGISSKTISYTIVEPMEKSVVSTPSQNSQIIFEIGSVSEMSSVIAEDIIINNEQIFSNNNGIGVSFLPENQPIISSVKLSFNLELLELPNAKPWNYELYKNINEHWEKLDIRFDKVNGNIFTNVSQLGEFYVLYNEEAVKPIPTEFILHPNYPNPFNGSTTIKFELPQKEFVKINIINILGENVKAVFKGSLNADLHSFNWDGFDNNLNSVASGVYFVQVKFQGKKHLQKIMYMK